MLDASEYSSQYNEIVMDGRHANENLPWSIEAMFYTDHDTDNGARARLMHTKFLKAYPKVSPKDIPLLHLDGSRQEGGPFFPAPARAGYT